VADNVSMQVRFNKDYVAAYRLIGFDNKKSALTDTTSILEGGEIGSGHSVMAVFEIVPQSNIHPSSKETLSTVSINYCKPGKMQAEKIHYECINNYKPLDSLDNHYGFAAAVCMFGGLLHSSPYIKNEDWDTLLLLTKNALNINNPLEIEFLELATKAKKIYEPSKKRKRKKSED
jgi:Ca-activated chloride channel family protein